MSTFYTTFLSKSDFSFVLLLITFEPLEVEQSCIPLLKALMCGINAVGAQGSSCMFTLCQAPLKMAVLLNKIGNVCRVMITAVHPKVSVGVKKSTKINIGEPLQATVILNFMFKPKNHRFGFSLGT